jgi:hypothetical protein
MHTINCIAIHYVDDDDDDGGGGDCTEVGLYDCIVCYIRRTIVVSSMVTHE